MILAFDLDAVMKHLALGGGWANERTKAVRYGLVDPARLARGLAAWQGKGMQGGGPPDSDALVGRVLEGRYRVEAKIGEGGIAVVYRGVQVVVDWPVAIKVIQPAVTLEEQAVRRFEREVRVVARLRSPHVVRLFDVGRVDERRLFLVMELLEGEVLARRLAREGPQPAGRVLWWVEQVAYALLEAHAVGVVHWDLKPDNVFVDPVSGDPDFIKVVDFGIAKLIRGATSSLTPTHGFLGTPRYLAPEQLTESKTVDRRADLYALGVIAYEALCGEPLFTGQPLEVLYKHVNEPPPPLRRRTACAGLAAPVEAFVLELLAKDPAARPSTAGEVAQRAAALRKALEGGGAPGPVAATAVEPGPRAVRCVRGSASQPAAGGPSAVGAGSRGATRASDGRVPGGRHGAVFEPGPGGAGPSSLGASQPGAASARSAPPTPTRWQWVVRWYLWARRVVVLALMVGFLGIIVSPVVLGLWLKCCEGFVYIPPGTFVMGSPEYEPGRDSDDGPQHRVKLTHGFRLGRTEVTQGQFEELMGVNPSMFGLRSPDCPVEGVTWWDALAYANALSRAEGLRPCYRLRGCKGKPGDGLVCAGVEVLAPGANPYRCEGYRLPTEAEWEYASRDVIGWYAREWLEFRCLGPHLKAPYAWRLPDRVRNVRDWCWDWYGKDYYAHSPVENPLGPESGRYRVVRGGSWDDYARGARVTNRYYDAPGHFLNLLLGFRLARTVNP